MPIHFLHGTKPSSPQVGGHSTPTDNKATQQPNPAQETVWQKAKPPLCLVMGFILPLLVLVLWDTILAWSLVGWHHMNDFGKFYYSTLAFINDQDMFGPSPASFIQVGPNFGRHFWNLNPPHFHIPLIPLGFAPPGLALAIWGIGSFIAFIAGVNVIGKELNLEPTEWQKRILVLCALAFAGTQSFLITGQLSFFLFYPFTLAWVYARRGNWDKAAYPLGLLAAVKPFLLLFIPYLILKRQVKAVGIIIGLFILCFSIGLAVFGIEAHRTWLQRLASIDWAWSHMNASILGVVVRTFTENPLYGAALQNESLCQILWVILSAILGGTAILISAMDNQPQAVDHAFVFIIITALLISPLGWIYYFFLPIGPLTALASTWWRQSTKPFLNRWTKEGVRNLLLALALIVYLIPLHFILLFQPNYWATFTIGSAYFWGTLLLWICLVINWSVHNRHTTPSLFLKQTISTLMFKAVR